LLKKFNIFSWEKVNLTAGAILSLGNMIGAIFGAKFTIEEGANWIRWIVFHAVVISSIRISIHYQNYVL